MIMPHLFLSKVINKFQGIPFGNVWTMFLTSKCMTQVHYRGLSNADKNGMVRENNIHLTIVVRENNIIFLKKSQGESGIFFFWEKVYKSCFRYTLFWYSYASMLLVAFVWLRLLLCNMILLYLGHPYSSLTLNVDSTLHRGLSTWRYGRGLTKCVYKLNEGP